MLFVSNDTATSVIYTLSLHDALPILEALELERGLAGDRLDGADRIGVVRGEGGVNMIRGAIKAIAGKTDRKSTRLNSSHPSTSYAVFCLKKKNLPQMGSSVLPTGSAA